jgi:hypothetical protein
VQIILDSKYSMFIWWGKHLVNIYSDAYVPVLGNRHPNAMHRRNKPGIKRTKTRYPQENLHGH